MAENPLKALEEPPCLDTWVHVHAISFKKSDRHVLVPRDWIPSDFPCTASYRYLGPSELTEEWLALPQHIRCLFGDFNLEDAETDPDYNMMLNALIEGGCIDKLKKGSSISMIDALPSPELWVNPTYVFLFSYW